MSASEPRHPLLAAIGPGLLMAGAAVGVSHLVQSTRAGADYGFTLLPLVLLACLLKYPFLEFGPRYAAATGESMIAGYQRMGRWAIGLFSLITLSTAVIIQAGVTIVTAGLTGLLFGLDWSITSLSASVLGACILLLAVGHYRGLDLIMKLIMLVLSLSTLAAVILALGSAPGSMELDLAGNLDRLWSAAGIAFVLALLGWMPIPLDVAAWHSLWTLERARQTGHHPNVREAVFDFRLGFIGATVLAALFLILGAVIMHGGDQTIPASAVAFSAVLVELYTNSLGEWARPLIAVAAWTTMFSTTLAVTDAYPRALRALIEVSGAADDTDDTANLHQARYISALILLSIGGLSVIHFFGQHFTRLIDFATTVSFLAAPILAWLSLRLITGPLVPEAHRPGPGLRLLAWAGFWFLVAFCLIWAWWRLS
ncbi:NRAMP family divalent metal transporter [Wenzhouxiangella marina]|uniref:Permease n=1 Tax=Wenzhouxiangella marina TaxID=1579979 RepID=A0A0K0XZB4_9GAMM|nr:divalent metal cation transporter [Wenzhouxiangella marina]AKS42961.1 permease [Wenzhouxiangella marina]MBB6087355.1 Mn2+/Fe2+ NRAMP family transporter [Wenzhouxiangella marina]